MLNAVLDVLSDGKWHRTSELTRAAGGRRIDRILLDLPYLAESDTGTWFCIPDDRTPMLAPDDIPGAPLTTDRTGSPRIDDLHLPGKITRKHPRRALRGSGGLSEGTPVFGLLAG